MTAETNPDVRARRRHWHLITRHVHPRWHGHCRGFCCEYHHPTEHSCDRPHWHFWWRHSHA